MKRNHLFRSAMALALCASLTTQAFALGASQPVQPDLADTAVAHYVSGEHELIKITHPDKPANTRRADVKYTDGIVDYLGDSKFGLTGVDAGADGQGDRGQTYCWGSVAYGDWMYVNTLYSAAGNTAELFPSAGGDGFSLELMNKISDCMYQGDIFLEQEDGGNPGCALVKINVKTGETKLLMSKDMTEDSYGNNYGGYYAHAGGMNPQFRNALEFNGKLYFCGAPSGIPSIWEIDPENGDAIRRVYADPVLVRDPSLILKAIQEDQLCSAIRGMTVFDGHLVISCVGPDANPYIAISNTSDPTDGFTKIATTWVEDAEATNGFTTPNPAPVAGELLGYPACRLTDSVYGGSIWEMTEFNGKLYVAMCTGTPANAPAEHTMQSFAIMCGEYNGDITDRNAWTWHVVVGDEADGADYTFGIDPERTRSGACCMMVFDDHLYVGEYNDTEIAVIDMICNGLDSQFMADNLQQSVNLYRMDKNEHFELVAGSPTELFPESLSGLYSGFGETKTDHGNQYIWQMKVFDNKLYIGTFDETVVLYPLAQLSNGDLLHWSAKDWARQLKYIKELIEALIQDSQEPQPELVEMAEAQTELEAILDEEPVDALSLPAVMSENNSIQSALDLHQALVILPGLLDQDDSWSIGEKISAKEMFIQLYERMYDCFEAIRPSLPAPLAEAYSGILNPETKSVIVNMGRCLHYLSDCTEGFDFFVTEDGEHLDCITRDGLGDPYNQGIRAFSASTDPENPWLTLGTANLFYGTQVWRLEGEGLNLPPKPEAVWPSRFHVQFVQPNGSVVKDTVLEGLEGIFAPRLVLANGEMAVWQADCVDLTLQPNDYVSAQTLDLDFEWYEQEPTIIFHVLNAEPEAPVEPEPVLGPIQVSFHLKGIGWIGQGLSKEWTVEVNPGQNLRAPRVRFGGLFPIRWVFTDSEGSFTAKQGEIVTYEELLGLLGGTTANGNALSFTSSLK